MKTSFKSIIISISIFVLSAFMCGKANGQTFAVKTNALMWGCLTPNLSFEMVTGEHTSFGLSGFGHKNPYGITSQIISLQPEFRYWFNGRPMVREFIGITALFSTYDMTLPLELFDKASPMQVYDGDSVSLGISGGYVFPLGKRFNLELTCGCGVAVYRQKQYTLQEGTDNQQIQDSQKPNSWGYKLIPLDLGITFSWIIR